MPRLLLSLLSKTQHATPRPSPPNRANRSSSGCHSTYMTLHVGDAITIICRPSFQALTSLNLAQLVSNVDITSAAAALLPR